MEVDVGADCVTADVQEPASHFLLPVQEGMRQPAAAATAAAIAVSVCVAAYALVGTLLAWLYAHDTEHHGAAQLILRAAKQRSHGGGG